MRLGFTLFFLALCLPLAAKEQTYIGSAHYLDSDIVEAIDFESAKQRLLNPNDRANIALPTKAVNFRKNRHKEHWILWPLDKLPKSQSAHLFHIRNGFIDELDIWFLDQHQTVLSFHKARESQAITERPFRTKGHAFAVDHNTRFVIARVLDGSVPQTNPELRSARELSLFLFNDASLFGLFSGIIIFTFLYHLYLSISTNKAYLWVYCCWIVAIYIHISTVLGYGAQFFWPNQPQLTDQLINISGAATIVGSVFLYLILDIHQYISRPFKWLALAYATLGPSTIIVLMLFDTDTAFNVYALFSIIMSLLFTATLIWRAMCNDKRAMALLPGWIIFIACASLQTAINTGFLNGDYWIDVASITGCVIELLTVAFVIGVLTKQAANQRLQRKRELTATKRLQNKLLQSEVAAQTHRLQRQRQKLEIETFTDRETGLRNQNYLFYRGRKLLKNRGKEQKTHSLIAISFENLSDIKKTLNRASYEELLRRFGARLKRTSRGKHRLHFRVFEMFFDALYPNMSQHEASNEARILLEIMSQPLILDTGYQCLPKLSIGVLTFTDSIEQFLTIANEAELALLEARTSPEAISKRVLKTGTQSESNNTETATSAT